MGWWVARRAYVRGAGRVWACGRGRAADECAGTRAWGFSCLHTRVPEVSSGSRRARRLLLGYRASRWDRRSDAEHPAAERAAEVVDRDLGGALGGADVAGLAEGEHEGALAPFGSSARTARSVSIRVRSPFLRVKSTATFLFGASFRSLPVGSSAPGGRSPSMGWSLSTMPVSRSRKLALAVMTSVPFSPFLVLKSTSRATTPRTASRIFFWVLASISSEPPEPEPPASSATSCSSVLLILTQSPSRTGRKCCSLSGSSSSSSAVGKGMPIASPMACMSAR